MDAREGHGPRQGLGPARPRRRRLPVRHEVDVRPPEGEARRQARLPPLQRGRVRARHVQGPAPHRERPAPDPRGDDARELRARREARLHLHPRRDGPRRRDPERGRRARPTRRDSSGRTSSARASTSTITVHRGAGAYICGEETALIESLEGKRGHPRIKPPFPAVVGRLGLPDRREQRRDALRASSTSSTAAPTGSRAIGRNEKNTGPKLYCVSGHVEKPGRLRGADRRSRGRSSSRWPAACAAGGS